MAKKLLPLISVFMVLAFVLAACATPTAAPATTEAPTTAAPATTEAPTVAPTEAPMAGNVVIWHSKKVEETNSLNAIIAGFKVLYPGVTVQALFVPDNDLRNKFETAVASGSGPTSLSALPTGVPLPSTPSLYKTLPRCSPPAYSIL